MGRKAVPQRENDKQGKRERERKKEEEWKKGNQRNEAESIWVCVEKERRGDQEHLRVPPSTTFFVISSRKMARNSRLLLVRAFGLPVPFVQ